MTDEPKAKWYENLVTKMNTFGEELGLDDMSTQKLRDFVFDIAKEQYKRGNKSGARWAFEQAQSKAVA